VSIGSAFDPTGNKFAAYYPPDITLIPDFFSAIAYRSVEKKPARIVSSIAMFYDLEAPIEFAARSNPYWQTMAFGISSRATCRRCCG